jgi:hypothetical protein
MIGEAGVSKNYSGSLGGVPWDMGYAPAQVKVVCITDTLYLL